MMSIRGRFRGLFEINFVSATGCCSEYYRFSHFLIQMIRQKWMYPIIFNSGFISNTEKKYQNGRQPFSGKKEVEVKTNI